MKKIRVVAPLLAAVLALPLASGAQVVREEGVKSIAGTLVNSPGVPGSAEWTFRSAGGEVLFASLDADIYRKMAEHTEHTTSTAPSTGGGCSDGEDDGGPGLFRLKVLDQYGAVICAASRPAPPPGWQRDPRMACALPVKATLMTYRIRVELVARHDEVLQPSYPFLLNISLRKIAPSGTNIQSAIAASSAGGF